MSELWYENEAKCWEEALPIGNGRIGGMVFGNIYYDRITLNEETLWSGCPDADNSSYSMIQVEEVRELIRKRKYKEADFAISAMMAGEKTETYLTPGDIFLDINNSGNGDFIDYRRSLNLDEAICSTKVSLNDMNFKEYISHLREYFVSNRDDVMVIKLDSGYEYMSFSLRFSSKLCSEIHSDNNELIIDGVCLKSERKDKNCDESIPFRIIMKIISDGMVIPSGMELNVCGATTATIIISVATGFNGYKKMPMSEGKDYKKICREKIDNALKYSMEGTRIYLTLKNENRACDIIIKNIASYEMTFNPDEITERFTRGDEARSTEGNGLGLSIAKSFTEACGGQFRVDIDGDMFIAVVTIPVVKVYHNEKA